MSEQSTTVGPWTLVRELAEGGNGVVWEARDAAGRTVALKLLRARRAATESYQRFAREIRFLLEHQDVPGLLPTTEAYLPDDPSRADRPWLAMPIATPIADALRDRPLTDVVTAVARIAGTLDTLERELGIAHRDIKPGNLYELGGEWFIGDFGLISVPDADTLTRDGRTPGWAGQLHGMGDDRPSRYRRSPPG